MAKHNPPTKTLCSILKKYVQKNWSNWDKIIYYVLWAYKTTYKMTMWQTTFILVYGLEVLILLAYIVPSLRVATKEILKMEETRFQSVWQTDAMKHIMKS